MRAHILPIWSWGRVSSDRLDPTRRPPSAVARLLVMPMAVALFSGCFSLPVKWVKPGSSQTVRQQLASCQLYAERYRYSSEESSEDRAARIKHEVDLCMQADGWVDENSEGGKEQVSKEGPQQASEQPEGRTS